MTNKLKKINKFNIQSGYSIVEVVIAISVFTIIISGVVLLYINGLESTNKSLVRNQATLLSAEGLEIVKSFAAEDFSLKLFDECDSDGNFTGRLNFNEASPSWSLGDSSPEVITFTYQNSIGEDRESYTFERMIKINELVSGATATTSQKFVESVVSWDNEKYSVSLNTLITNWRN